MTKAEKAQLLIDDGFIDELMNAARASICLEWLRADGVECREELWAQMKAVDAVSRAIVGAASE